ncbi:MAG: sulfite exporter TauE/SafE family protein [Candidatus Omnitrophota bacterium]
MTHLAYLAIGLLTGIFSGLLGIGGGIIIIPALIYGFGLTQHQAQGTSLAMMVPPITLLAAWRYYRGGNVKIDMAIFIAVGFAIGGLLGADIVHKIPDALVKRAFGVVLLVVSLRMVFFK